MKVPAVPIIIALCCARVMMIPQGAAGQSASVSWSARSVALQCHNGRMSDCVHERACGPFAMGAASEVATWLRTRRGLAA